MLLIKCPQCNRSYRLAESLYTRKAAGFGVVVTCRHCKTQIHVDEGAVPTVRHAGDPLDLASESDETDVPSMPDLEIPEPPPSSGGEVMPLMVRAAPEGFTPTITELDAPTLPPIAEVTELEAPTLPPTRETDTQVLPPVAPRAGGIPRPAAGIPRPGGVPRPGSSATGTPLPLRVSTSGTTLGLGRPLASATATPTPSDANTPTPTGNGAKPKIIALSPGLLGVKTALKDAPAGAGSAPRNATSATATPLGLSPTVPRAAVTAATAKAAPAEESAPVSSAPMSLPDSELFAIDAEPPPDSTVPIESVDYLESVRPVAPVLPKGYAREPEDEDGIEKTPVPQVRDKRLPHAPPVPHPPHPHARDEDEDATKRWRLPSGDLTDDLLSGDLGFDAPALAPPDASALMRAPVSVRPSGGPSTSATQGSTKAPVSKATSALAEKKSGRGGFLYVLLLAACGSAGYFWTHRVQPPPATQENAVTPPAPPEPSPPPVAEPPSATVAAVASAAPETSETAAVAAAAPTEAAPSAPATGTATSVAAAVPADKPTKPHAESNTSASTSTSTKPVAKAEAESTAAPKPTATSPAPTSTAVIESRGSAGTDPFDVAAARTALEATAVQASSCRKEGDPSGIAVVTITFSQTGRVTTAQISGPPFQATPTGGCIASTMRKTHVPPFAGDMVTVRKTVTIQ
jgi:hypothetical protein